METSKYKEELLKEIKDLSDDQISYLVKITRIFKESIIRQKEYDFGLKKEFEEWDNLSDEALLNFEEAL
ncbi:MAG TPA: hypothetical protein VJJ51_02985 [Candidatus Methanoperedens sp.]|nr:hypothetical protein [Candidatus Methanoperedens sp.]